MKNLVRPKVSVCMLAFNNEEYIEQAIDSVMSQQVDFPIELIIGEDASTDNVAEKIKKYVSSNNIKISSYFNEHNLGLVRNLDQTLKRCSGEYIAYLDNDDYWIDNNKIRKQVEFLDMHQNYSICYHPTNLLKNNNITLAEVRAVPQSTDINELAHGNYIQSCSIMFRSDAFKGFPHQYFASEVNDYFLLMLVAKNGLIGRLDDVMSVYRIHEKSDWSSRKDQRASILNYLECLIGLFSTEVNEILIGRHKILAYKLFFEKINEPSFSDRLHRCIKYGDDFFQKSISDLVKAENNSKKSIFSTIKNHAIKLAR